MKTQPTITEPPQEFDFGVTYSKRGHYYLAITPCALVTVKNGSFKKKNATMKSYYKRETRLSIGEVAKSWGVSVRDIDSYMTECMEIKPRDARINKKDKHPFRQYVRGPGSIRAMTPHSVSLAKIMDFG